jgi:hypothetical protein
VIREPTCDDPSPDRIARCCDCWWGHPRNDNWPPTPTSTASRAEEPDATSCSSVRPFRHPSLCGVYSAHLISTAVPTGAESRPKLGSSSGCVRSAAPPPPKSAPALAASQVVGRSVTRTVGRRWRWGTSESRATTLADGSRPVSERCVARTLRWILRACGFSVSAERGEKRTGTSHWCTVPSTGKGKKK